MSAATQATPERPPIVIVHLIRHATSDKDDPGPDPELSIRGERQCVELYESMQIHADHITHILSSPMKRCLQTARQGLENVIRRGLMIEIMPALAGRNGNVPWMARPGAELDCASSWIEQQPDSRSKVTESDFVNKFLTGDYKTPRGHRKVLEVVIVSQTQLLTNLSKNLGGYHHFPNARIFTYTFNPQRGQWARCQSRRDVDDQRAVQQKWKVRLEQEEAKQQLEELKTQQKIFEMQRKEFARQQGEFKIQQEQAQKQQDEAEKLKKYLLTYQDSMPVVDVESNEIVTFYKYRGLQENRYRATRHWKMREDDANAKPLRTRNIIPLQLQQHEYGNLPPLHGADILRGYRARKPFIQTSGSKYPESTKKMNDYIERIHRAKTSKAPDTASNVNISQGAQEDMSLAVALLFCIAAMTKDMEGLRMPLREFELSDKFGKAIATFLYHQFAPRATAEEYGDRDVYAAIRSAQETQDWRKQAILEYALGRHIDQQNALEDAEYARAAR